MLYVRYGLLSSGLSSDIEFAIAKKTFIIMTEKKGLKVYQLNFA